MSVEREFIGFDAGGAPIYRAVGTNSNGDLLAGDEFPENVSKVLALFYETDTGKTFRTSRLGTVENATAIDDRMRKLFPSGYTVQDLERTVNAMTDIRDLKEYQTPPPEPATPTLEEQFADFCQNASTQQRRERARTDSTFRSWYERESRIQRTGIAATADDFKPCFDNTTVAEFAEAFRLAPSGTMKNIAGFRVVPNFQNSRKLTNDEFERFIALATSSRLL